MKSSKKLRGTGSPSVPVLEDDFYFQYAQVAFGGRRDVDAAGETAAVELMLELGDVVTTVDANGDTALHGAIIRGSEPLVRFLLDQGADLEAVNEKGWTPLIMAEGVFYSNTGKRWPEMERLLLELGARPSLRTADQ